MKILKIIIHEIKCFYLQLKYLIKFTFRKNRSLGQGFICLKCGRGFPL